MLNLRPAILSFSKPLFNPALAPGLGFKGMRLHPPLHLCSVVGPTHLPLPFCPSLYWPGDLAARCSVALPPLPCPCEGVWVSLLGVGWFFLRHFVSECGSRQSFLLPFPKASGGVSCQYPFIRGLGGRSRWLGLHLFDPLCFAPLPGDVFFFNVPDQFKVPCVCWSTTSLRFVVQSVNTQFTPI